MSGHVSDAPDSEPMLGMPLPEASAPAVSAATPYRVLARKYRPQTFAELIGQDAMVQTLGNAIKRDRLAHAFLLTGVRGVGKTSTARLVAKALNCIGPDGRGGPTIDPCGQCEPCVAIAEGRHIDVVEMDAASNTGVDDVREIIESVRYAAVSARFKIYIIDEVHMLSKNAFNALLKTLEEPPAHVKFLFATTEVNKVPVTVMSRCQRFDLRRIPVATLAAHYARICMAEGVVVDPQAIALIARAADGSVRDGLSILDQAIAHADLDHGRVDAGQVQAMLGLSDRAAMRVLFEHVLTGDAPAVLRLLDEQHGLGVDPVQVLRSLLEIVHAITRTKAGGDDDPARGADERDAIDAWASALSFALLHRLWQLLLKGHDEAARADDPREAADMALLRIVYAATLPDPGELARRIERGDAVVANAAPADAAVPATEASSAAVDARYPANFAALVAALADAGKQQLSFFLHDHVRPVDYAPPRLVLRPLKPLDLRELGDALQALTGTRWHVELSDAEAGPTLREASQSRERAMHDAMMADPIVRATYEAFPEALEARRINQRSG